MKSFNSFSEGSLHAWFGKSKSKDGKPGWVQSDGSPCANEKGETKTPKCYSSRRLAGLKKSKEGQKKIRSADARKSRQDAGQQSKSGGAKPTMVRTFKDKKDYKKHPSGDYHKHEEFEYVSEAEKDKKGKGSGTKDACYHKVKSRYAVFPSAYASGALVKCRKKGAANWGNSTKKESYVPGKPAEKLGAVTDIPKDERDAAKKRLLDKARAKRKEKMSEACWKGYEKKGMKTMFGKRYPNCVKKTKKEEVDYISEISDRKVRGLLRGRENQANDAADDWIYDRTGTRRKKGSTERVDSAASKEKRAKDAAKRRDQRLNRNEEYKTDKKYKAPSVPKKKEEKPDELETHYLYNTRGKKPWYKEDLTLDELKCWKGYKRKKGKAPGTPGSCVKASYSDWRGEMLNEIPEHILEQFVEEVLNKKVPGPRSTEHKFKKEKDKRDKKPFGLSDKEKEATAKTRKRMEDKAHLERSARKDDAAPAHTGSDLYSRAKKRLEKTVKEEEVVEVLNMKKADMGDVVKDFYKSDAPQFKGKSKEKRRQMAIAAKLSANEEKNWIQGAIKKPGALHRELDVPEGEKIPAKKLNAAAKKGGKLGQRARLAKTLKKIKEEAAWQKKSGKNQEGGLNEKGRKSYERENPGSDLKAPVTKKPSELKKGSKSANRRKSFCARMGGMKKRLTSAKTANDPDSRINKALRKWNC